MSLLFIPANSETVLAATRGLQVLRAAAAVEGVEVASGIGAEVLAAGASEFVILPLAIAAGCFYLAEKYKPQTPMPPLFAPRRSTLWEMDHQRLKDYVSQPAPDLRRQLERLQRERQWLRWYSEGDQGKLKKLNDAITQLTIKIEDAAREEQILLLQSRLYNLNPNSIEAQRLRDHIQSLELAMGTTTSEPVGIGANASVAAVSSPSPITLDAGNWDPFNRRRLKELLAARGSGSPTYDPAHPPYVVFDFDNTTIFLDIEEAVLVYQLLNLRFNMTPEQLNIAIRTGVPTGNFLPEYNNVDGKAVNIDIIAPDIVDSYTWLYDHYSGFPAGHMWPLEIVKDNPHYQNFITKMRYLYEAIGGTFDHSVSYPWITYLFSGMTADQVRQLTAETVQWQQTQPIEKVTWVSPGTIPAQAGAVSVTWRNGLRTVPEMQELYRAFRDAGFDVWICSASFVDVIREFSSNPIFGYGNSPDRVLAMELERDANGVIQPVYRSGYEQTQGPGKTAAITRRLVDQYGYGPVFIAGDSEGDQNMMQDFSDSLELVLIVNRLRGSSAPIGQLSQQAVDQYNDPNAKILLQGRDENTGHLLPGQGTILSGQDASRVLPPATLSQIQELIQDRYLSYGSRIIVFSRLNNYVKNLFARNPDGARLMVRLALANDGDMDSLLAYAGNGHVPSDAQLKQVEQFLSIMAARGVTVTGNVVSAIASDGNAFDLEQIMQAANQPMRLHLGHRNFWTVIQGQPVQYHTSMILPPFLVHALSQDSTAVNQCLQTHPKNEASLIAHRLCWAVPSDYATFSPGGELVPDTLPPIDEVMAAVVLPPGVDYFELRYVKWLPDGTVQTLETRSLSPLVPRDIAPVRNYSDLDKRLADTAVANALDRYWEVHVNLREYRSALKGIPLTQHAAVLRYGMRMLMEEKPDQITALKLLKLTVGFLDGRVVSTGDIAALQDRMESLMGSKNKDERRLVFQIWTQAALLGFPGESMNRLSGLLPMIEGADPEQARLAMMSLINATERTHGFRAPVIDHQLDAIMATLEDRLDQAPELYLPLIPTLERTGRIRQDEVLQLVTPHLWAIRSKVVGDPVLLGYLEILQTMWVDGSEY